MKNQWPGDTVDKIKRTKILATRAFCKCFKASDAELNRSSGFGPESRSNLRTMSLPPVLYHYFPRPLPYLHALQLQESIHALQLEQRRRSPASSSHQDILLLLQHKPVYTAGRRQTPSETASERARLTALGADFVLSQRGGELTYHGPGQLVGYPLLDLGRRRPAIGIRDYICRLQRILSLHLGKAHGLTPVTSEHTGVFLGEYEKVASIGVQVRHRLTSHGFAMNVTHEPRAWFDKIVACGLANVKATSIEGTTGRKQNVEMEIPGIVERFGRIMERQMVPLELGSGKLAELVYNLEQGHRDE
jgi:lipoyl(octanoyl) transferase 2